MDLASLLGVSRPTVNAMIGRLRKDGLVEFKPHRSIFLTDEGRAVAERATRERHRIVLEFLQIIGVPHDIAEADAEGLEHHVSDVTLEALSKASEALKRLQCATLPAGIGRTLMRWREPLSVTRLMRAPSEAWMISAQLSGLLPTALDPSVGVHTDNRLMLAVCHWQHQPVEHHMLLPQHSSRRADKRSGRRLPS